MDQPPGRHPGAAQRNPGPRGLDAIPRFANRGALTGPLGPASSLSFVRDDDLVRGALPNDALALTPPLA
jgi:hypothetical protein